MRICFISLVLVAVAISPLCGEAPKTPPLPEGPLLKRMPESSAWSVVIAKGGAPGEAAPNPELSGGAQAAMVALNSGAVSTSSSRVIKSGATIWETTTDTKGKRIETWHYRGLRILRLGNGLNPIIFPGTTAHDIYTVDFKVSDFAGLDWIAPDRYVGIAKYRGRDCIVFEGKVSPLDARAKQLEVIANDALVELGQSPRPKLEVSATAFIDLETRFPVFVRFGEEKRTYQYDQAPASPLQLPADLASAVKEYADRIYRLSAPAGRPY